MAVDAVRLVVVVDRGLTWAVLADDVREIVHTAAWRGEPAVDVAGLWRSGVADAVLPRGEAPSTSRALVVKTTVGDRALLSPDVSFRILERSKVLSLPHGLAWGRGAAMVAGIVFGDSDEPLIVLNPDGFVDRDGPARDAGSASAEVTLERRETGSG
jgi:hypothetical protein